MPRFLWGFTIDYQAFKTKSGDPDAFLDSQRKALARYDAKKGKSKAGNDSAPRTQTAGSSLLRGPMEGVIPAPSTASPLPRLPSPAVVQAEDTVTGTSSRSIFVAGTDTCAGHNAEDPAPANLAVSSTGADSSNVTNISIT